MDFYHLIWFHMTLFTLMRLADGFGRRDVRLSARMERKNSPQMIGSPTPKKGLNVWRYKVILHLYLIIRNM